MLHKLVATLRPSDGFQHSVAVLTGDSQYDFAALETSVRCLGMRRPVPGVMSVLQLRRFLRAKGFDVVQGWMYHGNAAAALCAPRRLPVLFNVRHCLHRLPDEKLLTRCLIRLGATLARRRAAGVIYCSRASRRQHEAIGYPSPKSVHIPNGFDFDLYQPRAGGSLAARAAARLELPADAVVVGHVARFHPIKNHAGLIRCFARAARRHPQARLILAGREVTMDNPDLRATIEAEQAAARVLLLGDRADVPTLLAACDVYVSSSWSEAFPNALGEAMACAVPCVATDVGDSAALVGDSGFVVPPDDGEALTAAIASMLELSPTQRRSLGERARARVMDRYDLAATASRYAHLYAAVTNGTRPTACGAR